MATELTAIKKVTLLPLCCFYYRFTANQRTLFSRYTMMSFDSVSLIKSALDDHQFGWLEGVGRAHHLRAAITLVTTWRRTFLPPFAGVQSAPTEQRERWRKRYFAAVRAVEQAGIQDGRDERGRDADHYISLAQVLGWSIATRAGDGLRREEVDPGEAIPKSRPAATSAPVCIRSARLSGSARRAVLGIVRDASPSYGPRLLVTSLGTMSRCGRPTLTCRGPRASGRVSVKKAARRSFVEDAHAFALGFVKDLSP